MRKRIRKTLKTVWRLPETLFSPSSSTRASRVLAVASLLAAVAVSLSTSLLFLSMFWSMIVASLVAGVFFVFIERSFSSEYYKIREFEEIERDVLSFFPGFSAYSDINISEIDENVWVAYGHVEKERLISGVESIISGVTGVKKTLSADENTIKISYSYARLIDRPSGLALRSCNKGVRRSFPVTRLDIHEIA